jgi:glutaminase
MTSDTFASIVKIIDQIHAETLANNDGEVADYIPQLANVNPELYGISFCSVNGDYHSVGDTDRLFCIQSCCKPLNYCYARMLNEHKGVDVHKHVGYEPSGRAFNSFVLNKDGIPHNPLINAGAIMVSSLIHADKEPSFRFGEMLRFYQCMSGKIGSIGFDNGVFLSEKHHADRNMSLAYYMRENNAYPGTPSQHQLQESLDLYFQCCSVSINCRVGASMAGTLANVGISPVTKEKVVPQNIVRDCLSLMYACGMYDFSGQFAFQIGLPAKSGVGGCILLVLPNVGGICLWSPRLDSMGNSVRGVEFCKRFVELTQHKYHIFDSVVSTSAASASHASADAQTQLVRLIAAAAAGDLQAAKAFENSGVNYDNADYDGRTALHLAAAEGHSEIVEYLLGHCKNANPKDRWGNTPMHEAQKALSLIEGNVEKADSYRKICASLSSKHELELAKSLAR